jgi:hypothetical protein
VFEKLSAVRIIDGLRLSGQVYPRRARAVAALDEVVEGLGRSSCPPRWWLEIMHTHGRLLAKSASVNVCLRRFTCTRRSHPPFLTSASATSRGCRCSPGPCVRMRVVDVPASDAGVTEQSCPVAVLEHHLLLGCFLRRRAGPVVKRKSEVCTSSTARQGSGSTSPGPSNPMWDCYRSPTT